MNRCSKRPAPESSERAGTLADRALRLATSLLVAGTLVAAAGAAEPATPAVRGPRGGILVGDQVSRAEVLLDSSRPKIEVYLMRDRASAGQPHPDAIGLTYTGSDGRTVTVELTAIEPTPEFVRYLGPSSIQAGSYAGIEVRIPLPSGKRKQSDARVLRPVKADR